MISMIKTFSIFLCYIWMKPSTIHVKSKEKALIMGFPIQEVPVTLRQVILPTDGIEKQALATLNIHLLNLSGGR